jgi:hypothetical protein
MIIDSTEQFAVSTLPWLDGGSLYHCELATSRARKCSLSKAHHLSLYGASEVLFVAVHTYYSAKFRLTVHRIDSPESPVAWYEFADGRHSHGGDDSVFAAIPRSYTSFYGDIRDGCWCLFVRDPHSVGFRMWPDPIDRTGSTDEPDQDYIAACDAPGLNAAVVGTQRGSQLYVIDMTTGRQITTIPLLRRYGNQLPLAVPSRDEIVTVDSDVLVKIKMPAWKVENTEPLESTENGSSRFVGYISLSSNVTQIFVPRPFSRDALTLRLDTLETIRRTGFDCQPIEAFIGKSVALARDWKSGAFEFNNVSEPR